MIVRTDNDNRDCVIRMGAREAIDLFACLQHIVGMAGVDLRNKMLDWLENELVFDDDNNPNLR